MAKKKKAKKKTAIRTKPEKSTGKETPVVTPYPQAGRKVEEFERRLDEQLASGEQEKRGRGRPRKPPEPEPAQIDLLVVGQAIQVPFDLWSISQGIEGLKLTDDESKLMARPAKELLDYYLPAMPAIAWAWISLVAVSYGVLRTRLILIQEIKKSRMTAADSAADHGKPESVIPPSPGVIMPTMEQIKKPAA